jgi:IS605 OrfB family transposase
VKTIAKMHLIADENGSKMLLHTMEAFNAACNEISETCFSKQTASKYTIQTIVYHTIREKYNLSAQLCIRAIAKTCEAYKLNKKVKPTFKKYGSITYDPRILTFKGLQSEFPQVSLTTLDGRRTFNLKIAAYFAGRTDRVNGQVDLVYRDGKFFLYATCDMPEGTPIEPGDVLGVDLGVKNIAVDNTGTVFSNEKVESVRKRIHKHRASLQSKGTKSAKRRLKEVSGREARFRTNENHRISKYLVEKAKDSKCAIALEDLSGINTRTTVRKSQRSERLSWAFHQLRSFITYKAGLAGVPVLLVDPKYTSQKCNKCGHTEKANRQNQGEFHCRSCGHEDHADCNGAKNIRDKGLLSTSLSASAKKLLSVA